MLQPSTQVNCCPSDTVLPAIWQVSALLPHPTALPTRAPTNANAAQVFFNVIPPYLPLKQRATAGADGKGSGWQLRCQLLLPVASAALQPALAICEIQLEIA